MQIGGPTMTPTMTRPVLGVVCCTRTIGHDQAQAVMERYVTAAMRHADVAALLVPSFPKLMQASEVASRIDGLLLTGSPSNVEPARYGQGDAADAEGPYDPRRDTMSADLVSACLDLGRPVFGICRGLQELNVAFGGTLRRDMGGHAPELIAHHAPADASWEEMFAYGHDVELAEGGLLRRWASTASASIPCIFRASTASAAVSRSRPPRPMASSRRCRPG